MEAELGATFAVKLDSSQISELQQRQLQSSELMLEFCSPTEGVSCGKCIPLANCWPTSLSTENHQQCRLTMGNFIQGHSSKH
jgi:hypothetical protein